MEPKCEIDGQAIFHVDRVEMQYVWCTLPTCLVTHENVEGYKGIGGKLFFFFFNIQIEFESIWTGSNTSRGVIQAIK